MELARACGRGDSVAVKTLLARGADPNATTTWGTTPLEHAEISGRYPHICHMLLDAGAVKEDVEPCPPVVTGGLDALMDTSLDWH